MSTTTIRASSLPHYTDCMRRAAAKMFYKELAEYGIELNKMTQSIGATVGTATHVALEYAIKSTQLQSNKQLTDEQLKQMNALITSSVSESISEGVIWDDTTTSKDVAVIQAMRQARTILHVLPDMQSVETEKEYKADVGDGYTLSGHIDICGDDAIWDFKAGTVRRANQAQYGAYSWLCRSNGRDIQKAREIYIKRVGVSKPQPDPITVEFNVKQSEQIAYQTVQRIKSDLNKFRESGDIWAWLPNPNSMMCSVNYCPAFNTEFCNCHKK